MERNPKPFRGLTLTELLVALAITGLLVSLAAPGFTRLRSAAVVGGAADHMLAALHFARSAAALRGIPIVVCLTADGSRCLASAGTAAKGWLIFDSREPQPGVQPEAPERVLQRFDLPSHISVRGTRAAVTFWPTARSGTTATFEICDARGVAAGRAVVVSQTGRPRIAHARVECVP